MCWLSHPSKKNVDVPPMDRRRCVTGGIWQGTGEEEVDKAKERKKMKPCVGRKEVIHDFFWHCLVNFQGSSFLGFPSGSQMRNR